MVNQIILTALDVFLSDSASDSASDSDEDCGALKSAIAQLQAKDIPVIVFTERDRAELEPIRAKLGLVAPFITESGSGIFTPVDQNPFEPVLGEKDGAYYVEELGCPYVQARAGLRVIANEISHPLKGFGDFTVEQLKRMAKISEDAAHQAKAREFSEPFMTPKAVDSETLRQAAEAMGFGIVLRSPEEGRFSELIGAGAGLGPAVKMLIEAYQKQLPADEAVTVMGISAREQDLSLLAETNSSSAWTNVVLSADEAGPSGWLSAISPLLT